MNKEKWNCVRAIGLVVDEVKWYLISKLRLRLSCYCGRELSKPIESKSLVLYNVCIVNIEAMNQQLTWNLIHFAPGPSHIHPPNSS